MYEPARILMVDDESSIRLTLGTMLERVGYNLTSAENGEQAIEFLEQQPFDLLLVDLRMPGMDGMQVVAAARARQPDIAIIVLTGHGSLDTAIDALHQGVFDYVLKTAEPGYVLERVSAALAARTQARRQQTLLEVITSAVGELRVSTNESSAEASAQSHVLTVGALQLDSWSQEVTLSGRTVALTPTEFRVLLCLAQHAGTMLSYAALVRCAQGYESDDAEAGELIKPHIHHLRQKLEPEPSTPRYILNVRGKGYLLKPVGE